MSRNKISYEQIKTTIEQKGGLLITQNYIDNKQKLNIKCIKGHIFEMSYNKLSSKNQWCSICIGYKTDLDEIRALCILNECECLNTEFKSKKATILHLKCKENHLWTTIYSKINDWCLECKKNKNSLFFKMKEHAIKNNGQCIANDKKGETNNKTLYTFKCKNEHIWDAHFSKYILDNNVWCKKCSRYTIEDAKEIAKKRNGDCLSIQQNFLSHDKLQWKCMNDHKWEATFTNVYNNETWCPTCKINYGEEMTREIFENMFGETFPRIRPEWLINKNNKSKLELDGYCEKLKIAFEYSGIQHYKYTPFFHGSETSFKEQIERDKIKQKICLENNIFLCVVPYTVKFNELQKYIIQKCKEHNYVIPHKDIEILNIEKKIYKQSNKIYNDIVEIITKNEGELMTNDVYIRFDTNFDVKCKNNHIFQTNSLSLKRNTWCQSCKNIKKLTSDTIKKFAEDKNGKCLTIFNETAKLTNKSKIEFECINSHKWTTNIKIIKLNSWCIKCFYEGNKNKK